MRNDLRKINRVTLHIKAFSSRLKRMPFGLRRKLLFYILLDLASNTEGFPLKILWEQLQGRKLSHVIMLINLSPRN